MKRTLCALMILATTVVMAQDQFQKEAVGNLEFTKGRISQLANAMPDDKYSWAPADGVRSFSSVIGHVISANYFFGMKMGQALPEGVNPMTIEKELTTKAQLTEALDKSHAFVTAAISNLKSEEMGDKIEMPFPGDFTKMSIVNIIMNHAHEHMGQMIAYARMNGVTPPWSVQADMPSDK
jgi:uncharacterized damage-inducible protein DinB